MSPLPKNAVSPRDLIPFHPLASMFPLLDGAEFKDLAADIKKNGLREKITKYQGQILDGRNRYRACLNAKIEPQFEEFQGDDAAARAFVISKNIHRRHLTAKQKQDLLVKHVAAQPEKSDRHLAKQVGVSHPTIAKARREAESTGKALPVGKRKGADGKVRRKPAAKGKAGKPEKGDKSAKPSNTVLDAQGRKWKLRFTQYEAGWTWQGRLDDRSAPELVVGSLGGPEGSYFASREEARADAKRSIGQPGYDCVAETHEYFRRVEGKTDCQLTPEDFEAIERAGKPAPTKDDLAAAEGNVVDPETSAEAMKDAA